MTARLTRIERHPIKSHGRETLTAIAVKAGMSLPWDRRWAVLHEAAKADGSSWAPCANFSIGAKAPGLMAIEAQLHEGTGEVVLKHPDRPDLAFHPDDEKDHAGFLGAVFAASVWPSRFHRTAQL